MTPWPWSASEAATPPTGGATAFPSKQPQLHAGVGGAGCCSRT
jgi:hypothetical protein